MGGETAFGGCVDDEDDFVGELGEGVVCAALWGGVLVGEIGRKGGRCAGRRGCGEWVDGIEWMGADVLSLGLKSKKEVADAIFSSCLEEFQKYRVCVGRIGGVINLPLEGRRDAVTETAR